MPWGTGDALLHVGPASCISFGGYTFKACSSLYWRSSTDPIEIPFVDSDLKRKLREEKARLQRRRKEDEEKAKKAKEEEEEKAKAKKAKEGGDKAKTKVAAAARVSGFIGGIGSRIARKK